MGIFTMFVAVIFWRRIKCTVSFKLLFSHRNLKNQSIVAKGKVEVCFLIQEAIMLFLSGKKDCYISLHHFT